jgi:hypothetical protein
MTTSIPVWDTIVESWNRTYGVKRSFWAAYGIIFVIMLGFSLVEEVVPAITPLTSIISSLIASLLFTSMIYMGILRARNAPVNYQQVFRTMRFDLAWKVLVFFALQSLVSLLFTIIIIGALAAAIFYSAGKLICVLLAIAAAFAFMYIYVRITFGICYVLDKEIGPWDAIILSFNATRNHVWSLFGMYLLFMCLLIISAIPLGIGLIWTLPCWFVLYGVVYQKLIS